MAAAEFVRSEENNSAARYVYCTKMYTVKIVCLAERQFAPSTCIRAVSAGMMMEFSGRSCVLTDVCFFFRILSLR